MKVTQTLTISLLFLLIVVGASCQSPLQSLVLEQSASGRHSPKLLGSYYAPGAASGVYVSAGRAYVADGLSGLQIIDVTNPTVPTLLGSYDTPDFAIDVYVSGSTAYVADRGSGLQIIDVQ